MSAVMSTLSMISGGRRSHPKLSKKSSRNSGQYSDAGEERTPRRELREQRSASLQTLESPGTGAGGGGGGVAHLETLEAKMASIEVSLSTRTRRAAGGAGGGVGGGGAGGAVGAAGVGAAPARELDALRTALRDKESLIQSLKEQLCTTLSINRISASLSRAASPGGGGVCGGGTGGGGAGGGGAATLTQDERRTLEERAAATRRDADDKRAAISALKQALERLHVTDNIDTRIQQAELEYQLGREELQLLTLMEQSRALQLLIEQADAAHHRQTLYSCVREMPSASIVAVEAECDCKSPRFGAGPRRGAPGLWVDWARDDMPLCKGDRVVEVNGVLVVSCKNAEELWRALAISPRPARLVLLRPAPAHPAHVSIAPAPQVVANQAEMGALREQASEARRAKEGLRADNLRLTHRISYLEEQIAELLAERAPPDTEPEQVKVVRGEEHCVMSRVNKSKRNVTNISITSEPDGGKPAAKSEVQVFQKGPDITALVANLPGLDAGAPARPRSNMSNASAHRRSLDAPHPARPTHSLEHRLRHSLSQHSVRALDYQAETAAALEIIRNNQRQYLDGARDTAHTELDFYNGSRSGGRADAADGDATRLKKTNWAEKKTLSIIEQLKQSQRLRKSKSKTKSVEDVDFDPDRDYVYHRIDGKVLENTHKSNRRLSKMHARNVKSLDFESENSDFPNGDVSDSPKPIDYSSEPSAVKLGYYRKHGQGAGSAAAGAGEGKTRPLPPKKPLRLSLHRAHSSHSVGTDVDCSSGPELPRRRDAEQPELRKTTKRSHKGERGPPPPAPPAPPGEGARGSCATPKPSKKLLDGLSPHEARGESPRPHPHPRTPPDHFRFNGHLSRAKWC